MTFPFPQMPPANVAASIVWTDSAVDTSNNTTYTFTTRNIGAAGSRKVVVSVGSGGSSGGTTSVTSLTVGGISATQVVFADAGDNVYPELWQASVPSGTTATIVVTFGGAHVNCAIGVWAIYSAGAAASNTNSATGTGVQSASLNIPAGGVAIAFVNLAGSGGTPRTVTWANLSENFDATIEGSISYSGSSAAFVAQQTGLAITATASGGLDRGAIIAASWGPA